MRPLAILTVLLALSSSALADNIRVATGVMGMINSTRQGGQGAEGSTILSQAEIVYSGSFWSVGGFFLFDQQGSNQTDIAAGPKIELHTDPFYIEAGYMAMMTRSFTDRSIAQQTGNGWVFGLGVRFPLKGGRRGRGRRGGDPKGLFLQFVYKYRIQNVEQQDGTPLSQPIEQVDGYPLFGVGIAF